MQTCFIDNVDLIRLFICLYLTINKCLLFYKYSLFYEQSYATVSIIRNCQFHIEHEGYYKDNKNCTPIFKLINILNYMCKNLSINLNNISSNNIIFMLIA